MSILTEISKNIINLPRYAKRIIAVIIDIGLCIICTWLAFYLRLEEFVKINNTTTLAVYISILLAIPIFWLIGLYKTIFRFQGSSIIFTVFIGTFAYSGIEWRALNYLNLDKEKSKKMIDLLSALDELEDVQNIFTNVNLNN